MKIKKSVLRIFVVCIMVYTISGCGFYMTTEERIELFSQGKGAGIADDLQIEQLESLQFSQLTISSPPYSEKLFGSILLGLSEEEVDAQIKADREKAIKEYGLSKEEADKQNVQLLNGEAYAMRSNGGVYYQLSQDAFLYRLNILSSECLLFPDAQTVGGNTYYHYDILDSIFTKEQLDGCTREEARQETEPIAAMLGYSPEESEIYAVDADTLNAIHEKSELPIPGSKKDENGNIIKEVSEWTKEQEIYLILYKKVFQNKVIESVGAENVLFVYYHPEKKIIFLETDQPELSTNIRKESMRTVISGEEAVQMAQIYFGELDSSIQCTITRASFRYMAPSANKNLTENTTRLEPCWKIEYYYTSSGKTIRDHILLNAETGELVGNDVTY